MNSGGLYLVTGGAGFIGVNLIRFLAASHVRIRVFDNLSAGRREDLADLDVEFIEADIRDAGAVDRAVQGVSKVIHLAADTSVIDSVKNPQLNLDINVRGTFNLLQASVKHNVQRFVFASTGGAIIGDVAPPVHEDMPPSPISPYGASKLAAEGYCSAFWGAYGLQTINLRFANVYGPFSYHKGSVVAMFFRQVRSGKPLVVYGDGGQTRDFVFAGDLCRGIAAALEAPVPFGRSIQLGSSQETSINDLIAVLRQVVGDDRFPPVVFAPERPGEVRRNFVSIARAREYLNFRPSTDLRTGLQETWEWFNRMC